MTDEKRPYRKKKRAELEEQTRRRITESAVELHGTIGPALTSISSVARHAGVRRSTVYRHFPDETALFTACSTHWLASNPPPDMNRWAAIDGSDERLRAALADVYAYFGQTHQMVENILRDEPAVPALTPTLVGYRAYLEAVRQMLLAGMDVAEPDRQQVSAAIGHALAFPTWRSLVREQGLDEAQAVDLMFRLVRAASRHPTGS